jgi:hypothetical protein
MVRGSNTQDNDHEPRSRVTIGEGETRSTDLSQECHSEGFAITLRHGDIREEFHSLVEWVLSKVTVDNVKVIIGADRPADGVPSLPSNHVEKRTVVQDIITGSEELLSLLLLNFDKLAAPT